MKGRAFIQALFLVLFLVGSWFLLFMRLAKEEPIDPGEVPSPSVSQDEQVEPPVAEAPSPPQPDTPKQVQPTPPESWAAWIQHLESASSPEAMRTALKQLADSILSSPKEDALQAILEFLQSGADLKTGLGFQPGPENSLVGTASLRAFLLDLLHQLDPGLAAEWATDELSRLGTSLTPDVYAVHLRNYALGTTDPEEARIDFLNRRLEAALQDDQWTGNPSSAIAELLDVAVYTGETAFVPEFSNLMKIGDPQMLRRAAALAIERLVDKDPVVALTEILEQDTWPEGMEKARAGYFARMDPGLAGAPELLEEYLTSPKVSAGEARFFLLSFPNLNQSLSHNLLSSQISITGASTNQEIMKAALDLVRDWRSEPGMSRLEPTLTEVEEAINERLYGRVNP
ncbi:hypothetical protein G0Q06_06260 [Puniceicoccales bacterium CK1056]|uniref:Uncharacterized protein n=1 Tax=Oceanipulchritudo coccoides TaxID=2706888 RepID=A0A6B2M1N1_9BACT|nr:hypothetical protein [Oceanipulchritudo coccoides]NDV62044.1 hypothetical protein [Oceanipulchritudo coccoides]